MTPKLRALILREYLHIVRRKAFLISTILMPFFLAVPILLPKLLVEKTQGHVSLAVQDLSGTGPERWDKAFGEYRLPNSEPKYQISWLAGDSAALDRARQEIRDKKLAAALAISEDFASSGRVQLYARSITDFLLQEDLRRIASDVLRNLRMEKRGIPADVFASLARPADLQVSSVLEEKQKSMEGVVTLSMVFVILLYGTLVLYGTSVMNSVVEDKASRVYEVLLSCVTARDLLLGKVVGVGLASLTQYVVWTLSLLLLTVAQPIPELRGVSIHPKILLLLVGLFAFGYLLYAMLYAAIGSLCSSAQEAAQAQIPLIVFLIVPIMIAFPLMMRPDGPLAIALSLFPMSSPVIMCLRVGVTSPGPIQIALCFAFLFVAAMLAYFLSGKVFRIAIMVHGRRPPWRQVAGWLFDKTV